MRILDRYADGLRDDLLYLDLDSKAAAELMAYAHAHVEDAAIIESLVGDLAGIQKYKFAHPKTGVPCRYIFLHYPQSVLGEEVIVPVWISERTMLDPHYDPLRARLGIPRSEPPL